MKSLVWKIAHYPIYSLLLAILVIVYLMSSNAHEVSPNMGYRSLLIGSFLVIALGVIFNVVVRNVFVSSFMSGWAVISFYGYGRLYSYMEQYHFVHLHRYLIPFFLIVFLSIFSLSIRNRESVKRWTPAFNTLLFVLILWNLSHYIWQRHSGHEMKNETGQMSSTPFQRNNNIYYLIPDGYAHDAVLKNYYGFDNSFFLDSLRRLGFSVKDTAYSNYFHTKASLSSTLNMDIYSTKNLKSNFVFSKMNQEDYTIHLLSSGYSVTEEIDHVSRYYQPMGFNELERVLLQMDKFHLAEYFKLDLAHYYQRQMDVLNGLRLKPNSRQFVFVHMVFPHPPFVWDSVGRSISQYGMSVRKWTPHHAYIEQLIYSNHLILKNIEDIIARDKNAIILIQSDHGSYYPSHDTDSIFHARAMVLSAIRAPQNLKNPFATTHTSVNTFVHILNYLSGKEVYPIQRDTLIGKNDFLHSLSIFEK